VLIFRGKSIILQLKKTVEKLFYGINNHSQIVPKIKKNRIAKECQK
jgi:hypothetical protein